MQTFKTLPLLAAFLAGSTLLAAEAPKRPTNLLFIITDQQRFDALGCAGNPVVKTPNLDRLAREGARFVNAYSSCPVCVPARGVILTGHTIESSKIVGNGDVDREDVPNLLTFDQVLLRNGYRGEYHGKWHIPYKFALDYTHPVLWLNGKQAPPGSKAAMSEAETFKNYVAAHVPARELKPGERIAGLYERPYLPDKMDPLYGSTPEQKEQPASRKKKARANRANEGSKATTYGCLVDVPPEHTLTAWTVKEGLEALERLKGGPFTLTVSIGPPHPPMVLPKPYFGMYAADSMPVPASINDSRANSPYFRPNAEVGGDAYRDPAKIQQMISDYYGLVSLNDDWIGRLLKRLEELGLADQTLVIFTSDHGEMLGDHGMHSKTIFYEGSAHIPLLMRLPGVIKPGTVVRTPVSHIDCYATILDYLRVSGPPSQGRSLRPLIEGSEDAKERIAVSEWARGNVPGFMAFDGRWKLMFARTTDGPSLDALYDLKNDPHELTNLLGRNPDREKYRAEAERLKKLLVAWLERVQSPCLEPVKARPVMARAGASKKTKP